MKIRQNEDYNYMVLSFINASFVEILVFSGIECNETFNCFGYLDSL